MIQLGTAHNIFDLKVTIEKLLREDKIKSSDTWFGYDDGSIIIQDAKDGHDVGYINSSEQRDHKNYN